MKPKPRVGISSCLLGECVRYDGGHKRDANILDTLGELFEFVPFCPEVAIGLGVPREPIHLIGDPHAPRAVGVEHPELDVTAPLTACGERMAQELDDLSGYIFKSRSPSCGVGSVVVEGSDRTGSGLYARAFQKRHPTLPVAEEDQLADPVLRADFIERVFAHR